MSTKKPLVVNFEGLKKIGHPYSRTQTWRKMEPTITVTRTKRDGTKEERVIPNPDPFPQGAKLGWHKSSPYVWRVVDVLAYYERHGLQVTEDWHSS